MPGRIEDYAIIGDLQTAALVCRNGSIDWLCFPRFDSAACFAALLGNEEHGRWLLAPAGGMRRVSRRYRGDTLILETTWETESGTVRVLDFMPPRGIDPDIVRLVEGVEGRVPMRMDLAIRFDYGRMTPWVHRVRPDGGAGTRAGTTDGGPGKGDLRAVSGPDALNFCAPVPVWGQDRRTVSEFTVAAGDRLPFVLTWFPSHHDTPAPIDPLVALDDTVSFWEEWMAQSAYDGRWKEPVTRSLLTLKALTYQPTGGIVAAVTTSLPEHIGGERNWDYRYCWLRDATMTLTTLMRSGHDAEALAWREWLLRAVGGDPAKLSIMYGVAGEPRLPEVELDWLPGYEGSRPVRVGNAAYGQRQLDVYGELMDVLYQGERLGVAYSETAWRMQASVMDFLEGAWREPDDGLWEVRGGSRHFTHSKALAWVAFDRAVRTVEESGRDGPVERWRALRDEVHAEVCAKGYDADRNTFTQSYGSRDLDASLLLLPAMGFLPPSDPRIVGTIEAVERELCEDGFVHRYRTSEDAVLVDGLHGREGAFLACTFWLADALAMIGRTGDALRLFERLLDLRNDVGLLSEEYDPRAHRMLGNFPQAFSHVPLINTAQHLDSVLGAAGKA
jgi:GH15 family glucan-1,4-alpha-glucosidase